MMTEWYDCVNAVMMAYYPGMEGGTAMAEILYGDVNPSGKLPYVVPYREEDLPYVDWEATDQYYEYYHGYTRLEKHGIRPLVPYGYGLSYTTFDFAEPTAAVEGDQSVVHAKVKNTGTISGDEVVQVYVGFENSSVDRPVKQLKGFSRVPLQPGEEKVVQIAVPLEKLNGMIQATESGSSRRWNIPFTQDQVQMQQILRPRRFSFKKRRVVVL